jgi:hypothetical protein
MYAIAENGVIRVDESNAANPTGNEPLPDIWGEEGIWHDPTIAQERVNLLNHQSNEADRFTVEELLVNDNPVSDIRKIGQWAIRAKRPAICDCCGVRLNAKGKCPDNCKSA